MYPQYLAVVSCHHAPSDAAPPHFTNLRLLTCAGCRGSAMMRQGGNNAAETEKNGRRRAKSHASALLSRSRTCPSKRSTHAYSSPSSRPVPPRKKKLCTLKHQSPKSLCSPVNTSNTIGLARVGGSAPFGAFRRRAEEAPC